MKLMSSMKDESRKASSKSHPSRKHVLHYPLGASQIAASKDQDRFHTVLNKGFHSGSRKSFDIEQLDTGPDFFAVFDGHGTTSLAADVCVSDLYNAIMDAEKQKFLSGKNLLDDIVETGLPSDDAIRDGFIKIDERIKEKAKESGQLRTGTCAVCLFLEPLSDLLQNLPDMEATYYFKELSFHSQLTNKTGDNKENKSSPKLQASKSVGEDLSRLSTAESYSLTGVVNGIPCKLAWVGDSRAIIIDYQGDIVYETVDHKVETNKAEQQRIEEQISRAEPREGILESEYWRNELEVAKKENRIPRPKSFIGQRQLPGGAYIGAKVLFAYSNGISLQISRSLGDPLAARSAIPVPEYKTLNLTLDFAFPELDQSEMMRKASTHPALQTLLETELEKEKEIASNSIQEIKVTSSKGKEVKKEKRKLKRFNSALKSNFNKIKKSGMLGSAFKPKNKALSAAFSYRFVLASDGVWDVLTNKQVSKLIKGIKDPQVSADLIARQAEQRRLENGNSMDDITVVIVDIPPPQTLAMYVKDEMNKRTGSLAQPRKTFASFAVAN